MLLAEEALARSASVDGVIAGSASVAALDLLRASTGLGPLSASEPAATRSRRRAARPRTSELLARDLARRGALSRWPDDGPPTPSRGSRPSREAARQLGATHDGPKNQDQDHRERRDRRPGTKRSTTTYSFDRGPRVEGSRGRAGRSSATCRSTCRASSSMRLGMLPLGIVGGGDDLEVIHGDAYYQSYICRIPRSSDRAGRQRAGSTSSTACCSPRSATSSATCRGCGRCMFPDKSTCGTSTCRRTMSIPRSAAPSTASELESLAREGLERRGTHCKLNDAGGAASRRSRSYNREPQGRSDELYELRRSEALEGADARSCIWSCYAPAWCSRPMSIHRDAVRPTATLFAPTKTAARCVTRLRVLVVAGIVL